MNGVLGSDLTAFSLQNTIGNPGFDCSDDGSSAQLKAIRDIAILQRR